MIYQYFKHIAGMLVLLVLATACTSIIPVIAPSVEHEDDIGDAFPYQSRYVDVLGSRMHYVEEGASNGPAVVLVHGNPTSSYLWRNIIPTLAQTHRVIALDLIGMGKSDKPDIDYTLQDQQNYFAGFMRALKLRNVSLVLHDWGGGIGVHYARTNQNNIKDIMMIEAVHRPMEWSEADMVGRYLFQTLRDEEDGYELIVEDNYFIEKILPMMAGRKLSETEMNVYRAPYTELAHRKPVRQWPLEIPISGTPQRNVESVGANYAYLKDSDVPVHFVYAEPGLIYSAAAVQGMRQDIPRARFTSVGEGLHYLQESKPRQLSGIIASWLNR